MPTKINIAKYGELVGTREQGREAQEEVVQTIREMPENENLVLSLDGVKVFSGSFADEAVTTPYQRLVNGEYGEKYMFLECKNKEILDDLEAKLDKRKLAMLVHNDDSKWDVVGTLKKHLKETLEKVVEDKQVTANDLAKKLGISLTNCNNRLSTLQKMGLIKREKVNNPVGGIFLHLQISDLTLSV
jgi:Transcriptional regulators